MNIHHLELFYYVARHGGVSAAARQMPYGVQQPAISAQVIQLEDSLGMPLFIRRPFKLTPAGEELYRFVEPFFSGVPEMGKRLRGGVESRLRIGASQAIQMDYLPRVLRSIRERWPRLHFELVTAQSSAVKDLLLAFEIDMGIGLLENARVAGVREKKLLSIPLALVVREGSAIQSAKALWSLDRIGETLITGPADNPVSRLFQAELRKWRTDCFPGLELHAQELIVRYAREGFGVGLILREPGVPAPAGTRVLPLDDFPPIAFGLLWTGTLSPLQKAFFEEAVGVAKEIETNSHAKNREAKEGARTK